MSNSNKSPKSHTRYIGKGNIKQYYPKIQAQTATTIGIRLTKKQTEDLANNILE